MEGCLVGVARRGGALRRVSLLWVALWRCLFNVMVWLRGLNISGGGCEVLGGLVR